MADAYRRQPARRVRYACPVWRDPWLWLGRRTYAADLLGLAGGERCWTTTTRYPKLDSRSWPPAPEVVLLPSELYEFGQADADEAAACRGSGSSWPTAAPSPGTASRIPAALAAFRELLGGARAAST